MRFIALVDCDNFFVSCERLFQPHLRHKPTVVLSRNDGCIIARSKEAKALGIPMGAPLFRWKPFLKNHDVEIFSSNFSLYGDLSSRVMRLIESSYPHVEIYSVDEAFVEIDDPDPVKGAFELRERIAKWVGIPVTIGLARSKTLAKVAAKRAKRQGTGVDFLETASDEETALTHLPVGDLWGIGRRLSVFLKKHGVHSALALRNQSDTWVKRHLSVVGLRLVWELRGTSCLPLEDAPTPNQSILTSRSFHAPLSTLDELEERIARFTAKGAQKLRRQKKRAGVLNVFIRTSPHKDPQSFYANESAHIFVEPTAYTPHLIEAAKKALRRIFRPHLFYKRAGVLLADFADDSCYQRDLFFEEDSSRSRKQTALMHIMDEIQEQYGHQALYFAAEGPQSLRNASRCSPCYTTCFEDLLTIQL